jgi:acyl carrier protein
MWAIAIVLVGLVVFLIGTCVVQSRRGRYRQPQSPKEAFLEIISEDVGIDQKWFDASTPFGDLLGDELDITELFQDLEQELGIKLPDPETANVDTVGGLWELVERKIATRGLADEHRGNRDLPS